MRTLLSVTLLLVASGCAVTGPFPAQDDLIPGANVVIVRTSDDPRSALGKLAEMLEADGFNISHLDHGALTLDARGASNHYSEVRMRGVSRFFGRTEIVLTAEIVGDTDSLPVRASHGAGRRSEAAFQLLSGVAESYPGGRVLYARSI